MENTEVDIHAILGVLKRQLRLIITVALTVIVLAGIVTFTLQPVYTASTLVLVDTRTKNLLDPDMQFAAGSNRARVDSEVELARSDAVLLRVVRDLNLEADPAFAPQPGLKERILAFLRIGTVSLPAGEEALAAVLSSLRSVVKVQRRGLTYVISVQASSADPNQAARIANAVARNYIEAQVAAKVDSALLARNVLAARLGEARRELASANETSDAYQRVARDQYQALLARAQNLDTQVSLQIADSRIVSPALPPVGPSFPNKRLILVLAGMAGVILGVVLAFLYETYVGGFTSEQQAQSVLRGPIVAAIPRLRGGADPLSPADMVSSAPLSAFAESIRRVRASLDHASQYGVSRQGCKVIVITSALPGEGKTTAALGLARSYAQAGKRTLLIDGDLRRPNVHRVLGLQPEHGLLDFLESHDGNVDTRSVVRQDPLSDAVVILGARDSTIPTDRIVSDDGFNRVISLARKAYDVVIVDTPPLLPVVDGLYISQFADALVFVLRWASTNQADARKSLDMLRSAIGPDIPVLTVLNQQEQTRGTAYHYHYANAYEPV